MGDGIGARVLVFVNKIFQRIRIRTAVDFNDRAIPDHKLDR